MTVDERKRTNHKIGEQKRLAKYGDFFSDEARQRGGQVTAHLRWHNEKFSERCVICLEELRDHQITLFKRYEV
jgi:hypothetical protein